MCNQFTLHREFRIDTRRTKFEQKTDGILYVCGSYEQMNTKIQITLTWKHHVLHGTSRKSGKYIKTLCIGSTSNLFKRKDSRSYQTQTNEIILYDSLPAYCIPKAVMMETGESKTRKYMCHLDLFQRFLLKLIEEVWIATCSCETSRKTSVFANS